MPSSIEPAAYLKALVSQRFWLLTVMGLPTLAFVGVAIGGGFSSPDSVPIAATQLFADPLPTTTLGATTVAPTTTAAPTTTDAPSTTEAPTTTAAPTTAEAPTTTKALATTVRPTTTAPPTTTTTAPPPRCDPNYSGCVPIASDVDCAGGSGNGPEYVRGPVTVIGTDIYGLDRDNDGIGCE